MAFIGMKLKAEIAQPALFQALVDDIERCHFFCHEKHFLACAKTACNDIGDGLGFPRSRGALKDEAPAF